MEVDDVDKLGLPLATAQELRDLVVSLKNKQLQQAKTAAAAVQEREASPRTVHGEMPMLMQGQHDPTTTATPECPLSMTRTHHPPFNFPVHPLSLTHALPR